MISSRIKRMPHRLAQLMLNVVTTNLSSRRLTTPGDETLRQLRKFLFPGNDPEDQSISSLQESFFAFLCIDRNLHILIEICNQGVSRNHLALYFSQHRELGIQQLRGLSRILSANGRTTTQLDEYAPLCKAHMTPLTTLHDAPNTRRLAIALLLNQPVTLRLLCREDSHRGTLPQPAYHDILQCQALAPQLTDAITNLEQPETFWLSNSHDWTPLLIMLAFDHNHDFLRIINTRERLEIFASLPTEGWLAVTPTESSSNRTALSWATHTVYGNLFLTRLLEHRPEVLMRISPETWSTEETSELHLGKNALYRLCRRQSGQTLLRNFASVHPDILRKIPVRAWYSFLSNKGKKSAFLALCSTEFGIMTLDILLDQVPEIFHRIPQGAWSALNLLCENAESRQVLDKFRRKLPDEFARIPVGAWDKSEETQRYFQKVNFPAEAKPSTAGQYSRSANVRRLPPLSEATQLTHPLTSTADHIDSRSPSHG